jgi:hypothetical protein
MQLSLARFLAVLSVAAIMSLGTSGAGSSTGGFPTWRARLVESLEGHFFTRVVDDWFALPPHCGVPRPFPLVFVRGVGLRRMQATVFANVRMAQAYDLCWRQQQPRSRGSLILRRSAVVLVVDRSQAREANSLLKAL